MHHPGDDRQDARRGRDPRRRQLLAAAAAADREVQEARLRVLVDGYPVDADPTGRDRLRPTAEFTGFRNSRTVVSISSRPASPQAAVDDLTLVCRTLGALDVDSAALVAGDDLALAVSASADHPSDLAAFVIGLTFGPAGVEPVGRLVPYQFDRRSGMVTWGTPRPVRASYIQGLWVEVLGPMCVTRGSASDATLAELLDQNRRRGHVVLLL